PLPMTGDADDIARYLLADMQTRSHWSKVPELRDWLTTCRLNPAAGIISSLQPDDTVALAAVERRRVAVRAARENLDRLLGEAPVAGTRSADGIRPRVRSVVPLRNKRGASDDSIQNLGRHGVRGGHQPRRLRARHPRRVREDDEADREDRDGDPGRSRP